jgi:hypothetical protein
VALADEHARVVDALGEALLEHERLQAALQEVLRREREHVIELVLRLVEEAILVHAAHERVALKDALGVLLVQRQQHAGGLADLRQDHLHAPELALVAEAVLAHQLELGVQALLLERTPRLLEGLAICVRVGRGVFKTTMMRGGGGEVVWCGGEERGGVCCVLCCTHTHTLAAFLLPTAACLPPPTAHTQRAAAARKGILIA